MIPLVTALLPVVGKVLDSVFPDPEEAAKAKLKLLELQQSGQLAELTAAARVIEAEANSEHWLTSTWRPITMLTFLAMLVGYWFDILPPAAYERITPEMFDRFVQLLEIGVGGYIVGRSATQTAKAWKS